MTHPRGAWRGCRAAGPGNNLWQARRRPPTPRGGSEPLNPAPASVRLVTVESAARRASDGPAPVRRPGERR
eukprot:756204-Hanusia_phi.AAC.3